MDHFTPPEKFAPPCATMVVEGLIAGTMTGAAYGSALWTWRLTDGIVVLRDEAAAGGGRFPLSLGRATAVGAGLFAAVVATYNGINCVSERVRGKRDWVNAAVAGFFSAHILSDRIANSHLKQTALTGPVAAQRRAKAVLYARRALPISLVAGAFMGLRSALGEHLSKREQLRQQQQQQQRHHQQLS